VKLKKFAAVGAAVATALVIALASPAGADSSANLKVGDVVCSDWVQSDTTVYISGHLTNGSGTLSIRQASSVGGAETVLWSASGPNISVIQTVAVTEPGRFYRACVTVTAATSNTWHKLSFSGSRPGVQADLGRHTAVLSPGARACGDFGEGSVHLEGTANADVKWSIFGTNTDYGFVGEIFSTAGTSVDEVFTPGPDILFEEMCVTNTSSARATASYELTSV
jgi:hypothetical protein